MKNGLMTVTLLNLAFLLGALGAGVSQATPSNGTAPSVNGTAPSVNGTAPSVNGTAPSVNGSVCSPITTHVLNTATGQPAADLKVKLCRVNGEGRNKTFSYINCGRTNKDGRLPGLLTKEEFTPGTYKVKFYTEEYFNATNTEGFYPYVDVVFAIRDVDQHYHIPLLLSPYGYSTYRGSVNAPVDYAPGNDTAVPNDVILGNDTLVPVDV